MKAIITTAGARMVQDAALQSIRLSAEDLVKRAAEFGVILTIEQVSFKPIAMGCYTTVVSVRPARNGAVFLDDQT